MRSDSRQSVARIRCLTTAALVMAGAALAGRGTAQQVEYTGGVQVAAGDYVFTERTTSWALLNGLSMAAGRFRLSATLPLVYQNSTAITLIGGLPVPTGGPDAAVVRQRQPGQRVPMGGRTGAGQNGLGASAARGAGAVTEEVVAGPGSYEMNVGDPLLQLGVRLLENAGTVHSFGVHALAKAPVADVESGVGTGEWDYGTGLSLGLGGERTFMLADVSYWVIGDLPDLPLDNSVSYAVSFGRTFGTGRWSLLGTVAGATSIVDNVDAPLAVGAAVGYAPRSTSGFSLGVSAGLSESSPDVSAYVGWRVGLGRRSPPTEPPPPPVAN